MLAIPGNYVFGSSLSNNCVNFADVFSADKAYDSWAGLFYIAKYIINPIEDLADSIQDFLDALGHAQTTPVVIDLQNNGLDLISQQSADVFFDIDADGFAERPGWVGASDAFLVRDLNGNGVIDNQSEMFGDDNGSSAFDKLAVLDASGNGVLTGSELNDILLWRDVNGNGETDILLNQKACLVLKTFT